MVRNQFKIFSVLSDVCRDEWANRHDTQVLQSGIFDGRIGQAAAKPVPSQILGHFGMHVYNPARRPLIGNERNLTTDINLESLLSFVVFDFYLAHIFTQF